MVLWKMVKSFSFWLIFGFPSVFFPVGWGSFPEHQRNQLVRKIAGHGDFFAYLQYSKVSFRVWNNTCGTLRLLNVDTSGIELVVEGWWLGCHPKRQKTFSTFQPTWCSIGVKTQKIRYVNLNKRNAQKTRTCFFRIPLQQWESIAIFIFAACSNVSFAKVLRDYAVAKNRLALTGAPVIVDRNMNFYCSFVLSLTIWWCCFASRICCVLVFG